MVAVYLFLGSSGTLLPVQPTLDLFQIVRPMFADASFAKSLERQIERFLEPAKAVDTFFPNTTSLGILVDLDLGAVDRENLTLHC